MKTTRTNKKREKRNKYMREYNHKRCKKEPWWMHYKSAISRCLNRKRNWYKKGIKFLITLTEIKSLWFRDKAYLLKKPCLHRKDNDGNYTFKNCKFIEFAENSRIGHLGRISWNRGKYYSNTESAIKKRRWRKKKRGY